MAKGSFSYSDLIFFHVQFLITINRYFSDSNLQSNLQENQLLAVFLNSIKYLVHLYYDVLKDCNALRDEDYYSIPLQNLNKYSNEKLINDLRLFENKLRNEVKGKNFLRLELSNDDPQRKIISGLILRLKYRRNFLKIIKDIVSNFLFISVQFRK
jgi:hypothetical protein